MRGHNIYFMKEHENNAQNLLFWSYFHSLNLDSLNLDSLNNCVYDSVSV